MTDAALCGAMTKGLPRASIDALADLRRLLDAHLHDEANARPISYGADEERCASDAPDAEGRPNEPTAPPSTSSPTTAAPSAATGGGGAHRARRT
jgi:hypothetical protein